MKKIIRLNQEQQAGIVEDNFVIFPAAKSYEEAELEQFSQANAQVIWPLAVAKAFPTIVFKQGKAAIYLEPNDEPKELEQYLGQLSLIGVLFPDFKDGRGYSLAAIVRERLKWTGELRAIGDVLRDQINLMRRCGFDAYELRADKNIEEALSAFTDFSVEYQGSVGHPSPIFRRERA